MKSSFPLHKANLKLHTERYCISFNQKQNKNVVWAKNGTSSHAIYMCFCHKSRNAATCSKIFHRAMASGAGKSAAFGLLILNVFLYLVVVSFAAWAVNHGIERSHETASVLHPPARIFPIYFPFGNLATGFVVIFSLIAGVVGFTTSITGINNVMQWNPQNLHAAAASSTLSWLLTLLAMGLACKEIDIGWTGSNLRTLEIILILVSGTQLFCTVAIHMGVGDVVKLHKDNGGY